VSNEDKFQLEQTSLETMLAHLDGNPHQAEIRSLWMEYEQGETQEAKLVKDLDKFEMIVQAFEYEQSSGQRLDSFFDSTRGKFRHAQVVEWVNELYTKRDAKVAELAADQSTSTDDA
jgi:putative hydrolase of HD superfamily